MAKAKTIVAPKVSFIDAIHQVVADKGFEKDDIYSVIEAGLVAAYKKKFRFIENINVVFDKEKEDVYIIAKRKVVENVVMDGMEILISEAKEIYPNVKLGDEVDIVERPQEYGRIATQTAMQVVSQRLRQLEQNKIKEEYDSKVGELVIGYILRKRGDTIYVDLGKVEAIMPVKHQIPGERYRVEDKIKVLLHSIEDEQRGRGLKVLVSRADKKFMQKLFEMEVPEIYDGIVEIKNIGRIAGMRSKIIVKATRSDVDPVGACVGVKGVRIQAIVRELGNERIDIIEYSDDIREFITNALSPATPSLVRADSENHEALAVVPDKDLSAAIGRDGSNVRIASNVTGYKIDVKSESQFSEDMSSPEARQRLDELFSNEKELETQENDEVEDEEVGTPLSELQGLTKRIIKLLHDAGVHCVEDLIELDLDDLNSKDGIGRVTAEKIMEVISENVEFEEDDETDVNETDDEEQDENKDD